jgi:hypothetical protein
MKQADFWQWWKVGEAPTRSQEEAARCKDKQGE